MLNGYYQIMCVQYCFNKTIYKDHATHKNTTYIYNTHCMKYLLFHFTNMNHFKLYDLYTYVHVIVINYIDVFVLDKHEVVDNGYVCSDC
jgi:hypothetical protein